MPIIWKYPILSFTEGELFNIENDSSYYHAHCDSGRFLVGMMKRLYDAKLIRDVKKWVKESKEEKRRVQ